MLSTLLVLATLAAGQESGDPPPAQGDLATLGRLLLRDPGVTETFRVPEVTVLSAHPVEPPCGVALSRRALPAQPARTAEEYLRALPSMHLVRRYGHGGPWRFSYRGFEAGFGRDVAISVEGVPINQPSHALDPGLVDLTFLPKMMVDGVDFCPGAQRPDVGAFATAASAEYHLAQPEEGVTFRLGGGSDGSGEIFVGWRPRGWDEGTFVAAEVDGGEGSGKDRSWRHLKLIAGVERTSGPIHARGLLALYDGRNDVPVLLREDDLSSRRVRFFGGDTRWAGFHASRRLLLSGRVSRPWRWGGVQLTGWLGATGFRLRDNLSGYLVDPVEGDGAERRQSTFVVGLKGEVRREFELLGDRSWVDGGVDLQAHFNRQRATDVGLSGDPRGPTVERWIEHGVVAAWARARIGLFGRARLAASVRLEQTDLGVRNLAPGERRGQVDQVGGSALTVAPKLAGSVDVGASTRLHATFSRGFRPPDGRLVVDDRPLIGTRFDTVEVGVSSRPARALELSAAGFGTWSPAERITDVLDGRLLESGATRRVGVSGKATVHVTPWVVLDADLTWTDARLQRTGALLPYTPRWLGMAGLFTDQLPLGPTLLTAGLRAWWIGRRPIPGGFTAAGAVAVDLVGRVAFRNWFFDLGADNVIPYRWRYDEHLYPSRWDPASTPSDLPVRHVVPGRPPAIRLAFGARFR